MALDSHPTLGPDGLTAVERLRQTIRAPLRRQLPDLSDDEIWAHTLAVANEVGAWFPQMPVGLTYAWSDGQTYSNVDRDGGIPDNARERALLRALLVHTLRRVDEQDNPLLPVAFTSEVSP